MTRACFLRSTVYSSSPGRADVSRPFAGAHGTLSLLLAPARYLSRHTFAALAGVVLFSRHISSSVFAVGDPLSCTSIPITLPSAEAFGVLQLPVGVRFRHKLFLPVTKRHLMVFGWTG
jgi:hypothetical protein